MYGFCGVPPQCEESSRCGDMALGSAAGLRDGEGGPGVGVYWISLSVLHGRACASAPAHSALACVVWIDCGSQVSVNVREKYQRSIRVRLRGEVGA